MSSVSDTVVLAEETLAGKSGALYTRSAVPNGETWARLGVLHGYGDHSGRFLHFMEWLAARGVACHAFDFRGQGRSSGRPGYVARWEEYLDDLDAFLASEPLHRNGDAPLFLLGHSHGALVLAAAGIRGLTGVRGCILSAAYFRSCMSVPLYKKLAARLLNPTLPWLRIPSGLKNEWMSSDADLVAESRADPLIVRTATPRWYVGCQRAQAEVLRRAPEFRLPFLALAGDADPVADHHALEEFTAAAGSTDTTLRLYPGHLHEILRETGREAIFTDILTWLRDRATPEHLNTRTPEHLNT